MIEVLLEMIYAVRKFMWCFLSTRTFPRDQENSSSYRMLAMVCLVDPYPTSKIKYPYKTDKGHFLISVNRFRIFYQKKAVCFQKGRFP